MVGVLKCLLIKRVAEYMEHYSKYGVNCCRGIWEAVQVSTRSTANIDNSLEHGAVWREQNC